MNTGDLITLVEAFASFTNLSEATISNKVCSHARLFSRLRAGKGCNLKTATGALNWFSENWPADLEWPRSIPRPRPGKKEAA